MVQPYRVRRDRPALADLRERLHGWVRAGLDDLTDAEPVMPLEDRAADTWEPLIALADHAGGDWPRLSRAAALNLLADREEATEVPLKVRLLTDCREAFHGAAGLPSAVLVERLRSDDEAPWLDHAGTGLTVRRLAAMLREYDISPTTRRWPDGSQTKGYARVDFTDAWARYSAPEHAAETPQRGPEHVRVGDRPNRPKHRRAGQSGTAAFRGTDRPSHHCDPYRL